ncbi:unnamed protein product [Leptidea sinapis]|uniref:Autophagy-related protein 13 n=1 Tax=Leptidea sinapis TaxID=189913 RepID=A0A5E4Q9X0_9NEOP|nr:unnamed protein product [Leptidea sinapis]
MSSPETQESLKLYKFTKILTLKIAQIVVQSRQGKKISPAFISKSEDIHSTPSSPTYLQWFNLSIPDVPEVNVDTKRVLNGEVIEALSNVLCIEISLRTNDGDEMILEMWTVKMKQVSDMSITSLSTIYYRMGVMLKSTLSISRITPAYKMSRLQNKDSYKISHKIYGGKPDLDVLGENFKTIKVSELHMPIGTIQIEVLYRTEMAINPEPRGRVPSYGEVHNISNSDIMVKSDHFPRESPRKTHEKKKLDLNKPLTAGAFVDTVKIKELHDTLSQQLPPEPPMAWLLAEKDKMEAKMEFLSLTDALVQPGTSSECSTTTAIAQVSSKAIDVPAPKYSALMCLQAKCSEVWNDYEPTKVDAENLSQQLKKFEEAVPEFDSMVASMFSVADNTEH